MSLNPNDEFDYLVIGGGSAGYASAALATSLGLRTAVVEGAEEMGGLCILRGCMPSKTLLESASRAEIIREAKEFGLRAEYHGADGAVIRARKRRLIGEFADYRRGQLEDGRFELIRGLATFTDAHTLTVRLREGGERQLRARACLIATGSRVQRQDLPGLREVGYWTSDEVLDAEHIPASVVILGGGAIALEMASFYAGVGSEVTVIQRSEQVLKGTDADVAECVTKALEAHGIRIFRGTSLTRFERAGDLKRVHFQHGSEAKTVEAEEIIYALGREPAIAGLNLAAAGVTLNKRGIAAEPTQQCGAPHLFAAGDVCGPHEIVHIAIQQGELAARNAARVLGRLDGALESIDYRLKLFAVFTHPEVAAVGLTEREATAQYGSVRVAKYDFADHGKALVRGASHGFVKLIAEAGTGRLLGGACVGLEASELIHEIVVAMHFNATAADLARVPHYHPTLSEIWTYPAEEIASA